MQLLVFRTKKIISNLCKRRREIQKRRVSALWYYVIEGSSLQNEKSTEEGGNPHEP